MNRLILSFLILLFPFFSSGTSPLQDQLFKNHDLVFEHDFLFGVANAPGHVEDNLQDIWMDFAEQGKIRAFHQHIRPKERLHFWTQPDIEINLAEELGVQIFRLGVDWGRIHLAPGKFDDEALQRYLEILESIKTKNMKIMLTLFHFSLPKWIQDQGGWTHPKTKHFFTEFSQLVMKRFNPLVDYWITFNEPQIFATMSYQLGIFPPGNKGNFINTIQAVSEMIKAHKNIYRWSHKNLNKPKIGIAQHMGVHKGKGILNSIISKVTGSFMNWYFPKRIKGYMDYFGFNYYGAEWIKGTSLSIEEDEEYSEAGRTIFPSGLYKISHQIKEKFGDIPQFITENGVSDSTDWIRPSYLVEHLKVIHQLVKEGVPLLGYIHWTLTDNMEWSDGYCPKFGLVEVDRKNNFQRIKRESFYLYQKIIKNRILTVTEMENSWNLLQSHVGEVRPFCRAEDGRTSLDVPKTRKIVKKDWRFGL